MKQVKRRGRGVPPQGTVDRQFLRRFLLVIAGLGMLAGVGGAIAHTIQHYTTDQRDAESAYSAVARRLAPAGQVATDASMLPPAAPAQPAGGAAHFAGGDEVVQQVCSACHGAGVLGAPKIGDAAAWSARLKSEGGKPGLFKNASAGKGAMPPRGGRADLSDNDLRAAIDAMLKQSGA